MTTADPAVQLEALRQQVAALTDTLARHSDALDVHGDALTALEDGLTAAADEHTARTDSADDTNPEPIAAVPDLDVLRPWVQANISAWCERRVSTTPASRGIHWCARWDLHPEAITRLWAVRAAQLDAAQNGPAAVSDYLRDHFDHHLGVLTGEHGPFHKCTPTQHTTPKNADDRYLATTTPALRILAG